MLDKQVHLYSVDTGDFYTDDELAIENLMSPLRKRLNQVKNRREELEISIFKKISRTKVDYSQVTDLREEVNQCKVELKTINPKIDKQKTKLKKRITKNTSVRSLKVQALKKFNLVSMFESTLTRTIGCPLDEITEDLFIIRVFYFGVLHDLMKNGFIYKDEKYVFYCASAGQIRKKLVVFVKESLLQQYETSLMCGLTINQINNTVTDTENGEDIFGMNITKFIAYRALSTSATDQWLDFDIDRCIVVDDFETLVRGEVDYMDWDKFSITRKIMDVPIPHMDGCGLILPELSDKNFIMRAPFIKGLLSSFDFLYFIEKHRVSTKVKDIYGHVWDLVDDKIQIIFTKSMFKMHKYYKTWFEYQNNFNKYHCQAGICSIEPERINDATISYQMLQTLHDMPNTDLKKIAQNTIDNIKALGNDKEKTLRLLGARETAYQKNTLQEGLNYYPDLAQDGHCRRIISNKKKNLVKKAKSGKLQVKCKYTYVVPDLYAFCEWLFLGIGNPQGILPKGEVSCNLFQNREEVDCLRSPHLYIEHGIRTNNLSQHAHEYFKTKAIYVSVHDLLSLFLAYDSDGDMLVVCNERLIIENAKRILKQHDIVPLYYNMLKAPSKQITSASMYDGLIAAYTSGQIGKYSNDITVILNQDKIVAKDIEMVKWEVSKTNFSIDSAKTGYEPEFPEEYKAEISDVTKVRLPYFFTYSKDKLPHRVRAKNSSVVNRLDNIIPSGNIRFNKEVFGDFDYSVLLYDKNININTDLASAIITKYTELDIGKPFVLNSYNKDYERFRTTYDSIKAELLKLSVDEFYLTDVLVEYLYHDKASKYKSTLWECFGDIIVWNIKQNQGLIDAHQCLCCQQPFNNMHHNQIYCDVCKPTIILKNKRANYTRMGNKTKTCAYQGCENIFEVRADSRRKYCETCGEVLSQKYEYTKKPIKTFICQKCSTIFKTDGSVKLQVYCHDCRDRSNRPTIKEVVCTDCQQIFEASIKATTVQRCPVCRKKVRQQRDRARKQKK